MTIGLLTDNKLLSLALQGYNPFQPDTGIFCGGYQGIMYPNPTTLVAVGFDPYKFLEYMPDAYKPDSNYAGLGKGNPGIDYKNPGHILGLLDTFGRMSYGLRMLLDIHAGSNASSFQPIVVVDMPMTSEAGTSEVGLADIYPAFTEVPSDWFDTFNVDPTGLITPTTRPFVEFPGTPGHTPTTTMIELENLTDLFNDKSLSSYLDLIVYFRDIIQQLATAVSTLNNKVSMNFTLGDQTGSWSSQDEDAFENYLGRAYSHDRSEPINLESFETKGTAYFQYDTNQPSEALNTLTGSTSYHDGPNSIGDYRSITELNSVINIVPLQMVGGTYFKEYITSNATFEDGRVMNVASYMLVDFIVNISNASSELQTVTLAGNAIANNLISDPTQYWFEAILVDSVTIVGGVITDITLFPPQTINSAESVTKQIQIFTSLTNDLSWDRAWLAGEGLEDEEKFENSNTVSTSRLNNPLISNYPNIEDPTVADQTPLTLNFSKQFVLSPGCNSIRMRALLNSTHRMFISARMRSIFWVSDSSPGSTVFSHTPLGDPGGVKNGFSSPGLQLSFTVTGTNMAPKTYNVEI